MTPISKAINVAGGVAPLAAAIQVPVQSVYFWRSGGRRVPSDYCPRIEEATGGQVRCEDLRPDVRWDVLRGTPQTLPGGATSPVKGAAHG